MLAASILHYMCVFTWHRHSLTRHLYIIYFHVSRKSNEYYHVKMFAWCFVLFHFVTFFNFVVVVAISLECDKAFCPVLYVPWNILCCN